MLLLKYRICSPGVAATVAMHAVFGIALLQSDSAQSSVAAAPVMVSLIDSAGQERVIAPPKRTVKPRPALKAPPSSPIAKAPEPMPTEAQPVDGTPAPESSITLPRFNADYLNNPPPVYPTLARRLGEQGTVLLRARVRADGTPDEVSIHRSSGSAHLDQAALEAVRQWRFIPARRGGTAVAAPVLIPISFTLQG